MKTTLWTVITLFAFALAPAMAQSPTPAKETPVQADPVTSARTLVSQFIQSMQTTDNTPSPDLFTNRTAAGITQARFPMLALELGLAASSAKGKDKQDLDPILNSLAAFVKKYGLNNDKEPDAVTDRRLAKVGRAYYADYIALINGSSGTTEPSAPATILQGFSDQISDYHFTEVAPTDVKITQTDPKGIAMDAVIEDGQWRLDLGDVEQASDKWPIFTVTSDQPKPPVVPESLFRPKTPVDDYQGGAGIGFGDKFVWYVNDEVLGSRDAVTDKGRKVEYWLGKKADYYHILGTNLIAIRPHDASYPRQDTMDEAIQQDDLDRVKELIHADPSAIKGDPEENSPLQDAMVWGKTDIAEYLIDHGAPINQGGGDVLLVDAVQGRNYNLVRALLNHGANPLQKDNNGETGLGEAKKMKDPEMLQIFTEPASVREASEKPPQFLRDNPAPLPPIPVSEFVHQKSGLHVGNVAYRVGFNDGFLWGVYDVTDGFRETSTTDGRKVDVVLARRADYYHVLGTDLVRTVWHDANHPRQDTIFEATDNNDYNRVKALLDTRPDLANAQENSTNKPALIYAVESGNAKLVQLFLNHGAKTNMEDNYGQTALQSVLKDPNAKSEGAFVTMLLQRGANVDQEDMFGKSALSIARENHLTQYIPLLMRYRHGKGA